MHRSLLKSISGRLRYVQIVTILLMTLALGIVAWTYFTTRSGYRGFPGRRAAPDAHMTFEQRIVRELETETKNRFFSHQQTAEMLEQLSAQRGQVIAIECPMDEMNACLLAAEIDQILEAAGWVVEEFLIATHKTIGTRLILRVRSPAAMTKAHVLVDLLGKGGFPVVTEVVPDQEPDLKIVVPVSHWKTRRARKETTATGPGPGSPREGAS